MESDGKRRAKSKGMRASSAIRRPSSAFRRSSWVRDAGASSHCHLERSEAQPSGVERPCVALTVHLNVSLCVAADGRSFSQLGLFRGKYRAAFVRDCRVEQNAGVFDFFRLRLTPLKMTAEGRGGRRVAGATFQLPLFSVGSFLLVSSFFLLKSNWSDHSYRGLSSGFWLERGEARIDVGTVSRRSGVRKRRVVMPGSRRCRAI